ncbi:MAG TPA: hypothetical protein VFN22_08015 [Gemmatimonadales bacterium]|nr:hypothetical protein [Gemmatimonadales bacterium]
MSGPRHFRLLVSLGLATAFSTALPAQATAIRPGVDTMTIWLIRGADTTLSGRIIDHVAFEADSLGDRIVRTYTTASVIVGSRTDTLVDRVDGLRPVRAVTVLGDSVYRLDFRTGRLSGDLRLGTGTRQSIDLAVPATVINASSFDLFLRGSLLHIGDSLHAVAFSPNVLGGLVRLSARVDGEEEVAGRLTWRVIGVFPPGMRTTFWIDQQTREMVQQRMELPGGVELLVDHRGPPRVRPSRRAA